MSRATAIEAVHSATAIYTSTHVVDALLDRLDWPGGGGRLLDPAAGDGAFLLRALARVDFKPGDSLPVQGWEIHAGAASEARARIAEHLMARGWSNADALRVAHATVLEKDFLTDGPAPGEYRVIAANPPYLRFGRLPEYFKRLYGDCLPRYVRADLLHAFLARCCELMPPNGVIGMVCSDRFLFNANATELRQRMGQHAGIVHLARIDSTTSFYHPKDRRRGTPPRIHPVELVMRPAAASLHAITGAAISPDELGRIEVAPHRTLGEVAHVRIAPWLGPFGVFVVDAQGAARLPGAHLVPAVDTDDIDPHTDELHEPNRWAIRTTRDEIPTGALHRHLKSGRRRMPKRALVQPYWLPPELINLSLDRPSLLVPRIARRLRAVALPAGVLPINHNLSIVQSRDDVSLADLRDILLSPESHAWIQRNAPRLESGYFSITTRLLRRLPV